MNASSSGPNPHAAETSPGIIQLVADGAAGSLRRQVAPPAFARHETFYPRFGWLKKGFDAALADPMIFLDEDAPLRLGVGKNMARSIRYWCHAFKVLEDAQVPGQRAMASTPSAFGRQLLGATGWDPYLEDVGSLWLLHWKLLIAPCSATSWHVAFGVYTGAEISVDTLVAAISAYAKREYPTARTAPSSFRKDASLIVRMYGDVGEAESLNEETLQCPFADLGLLRPAATPKAYNIMVGPKATLPPEIVATACLEYAAQHGGEQARTVAVSSLLSLPGTPGMVFKLSEGALCDAIEAVSARHRGLRLADAAGVIQIAFDHAPHTLATTIVSDYYRRVRASEAA